LTHPLEAASFRFRNFKGFGGGGPFIAFAPISILVGRNNSGKSAIVDAVDVVLKSGKSAQAHQRVAQAQFETSLEHFCSDLQILVRSPTLVANLDRRRG
jgi:predicted ATP-dependent endonuclease of OLD family